MCSVDFYLKPTEEELGFVSSVQFQFQACQVLRALPVLGSSLWEGDSLDRVSRPRGKEQGGQDIQRCAKMLNHVKPR